MLERWDDLRIFLAVARAGTLAAAADVLKVNASTLHRRISSLEHSLDVVLFDRAPRGYALTTLGAELVAHAEEVEEAVFALRRAAVGHDRSARGHVSVTLPGTMVPIVAEALAGLSEVCPDVRPVLIADDRPLSLGEDADIALRAGSNPPEAAVGRRVARIGWGLYCVKRRRVKPENGSWAVYTDNAGPATAIAWRQSQYPGIDVHFVVNSVGAMVDALRAEAVEFGMLPCYAGDRTAALRRVVGPIAEAEVDLWMLIHADLRRSARVRALLDYLGPKLEGLRPQLAGV